MVAGEADAGLAQPLERLCLREAERLDVELDEVRLDVLRARRAGPRRASPSASLLRPRVVVREPVDVVVERVDARRGDDPGLAHRAAEEVLLAARLGHPLGGARDERAERAAEALREAERDRVDVAAPISAGGTPSATAAFMSRAPSRWNARPSSRQVCGDGLELVERPDPAARRVVRVLDRDEPRARLVDVARRR